MEGWRRHQKRLRDQNDPGLIGITRSAVSLNPCRLAICDRSIL